MNRTARKRTRMYPINFSNLDHRQISGVVSVLDGVCHRLYHDPVLPEAVHAIPRLKIKVGENVWDCGPNRHVCTLKHLTSISAQALKAYYISSYYIILYIIL
jgi:hypothetical protein